MAGTLLLGIDVGTSSAKAALIDAEGRLLGVASRDHPTHTPLPEHSEQDSGDWWEGVCRSVQQVLSESGANPAEIAGLSLSGQGCACLPVDASGEPLKRASIWTDGRAGAQQAAIRERFGDDLGRVTGNEIYDQPEPRMMWVREHEPALYARTNVFLSTVSFLILRLAGQVAANRSDWGFHLAYDRLRGDWNDTFLSAVGLSREKLPPLFDPHAVVGGVTRQAAAETGLLAGTPVVAGGQDSTVSALAVGALYAGQSFFMRGTTDLLSCNTDQPGFHPDLYTTCAVLPGLYMSYDMKEVTAAGGSYRWLAGMLCGEAGAAQFEEMNALAADAPAGSGRVIFLPYLLMSTNPDPAQERSGAFFGLTAATTRGQLCRAVMEGTAFALRESVERMAQTGIPTVDLRATGGPTHSTLWNQITADVTGLPVLLPSVQAGAAYGAALLAGLGVGVFALDGKYDDLKRITQLRERFEPDPEAAAFYRGSYRAFRQLAQQSAGIIARLRSVQQNAKTAPNNTGKGT